jgi:uncharacterized protein YjeT (DUF2065 family)
MSFFLLLIGIVLIVKGVAMILAPKKMMKFAISLLDKTEPKTFGIVALVIGILLLFSARASALGWLIVLLGLVEIMSSVYLLTMPIAKIKEHWWFKLSDNGLRALGILVLVLGVIIFVTRI